MKKALSTATNSSGVTQKGKDPYDGQPSLSHLVQSLTRQLEIGLFERLGSGVRLTEAGKRLLQSLQEMVVK